MKRISRVEVVSDLDSDVYLPKSDYINVKIEREGLEGIRSLLIGKRILDLFYDEKGRKFIILEDGTEIMVDDPLTDIVIEGVEIF